MRVRDHFEDLVLNGRIILKCIFKKSAARVDWIPLAQGRERWWVVVEAAMGSVKRAEFLDVKEPSASHKGLCSMESVR